MELTPQMSFPGDRALSSNFELFVFPSPGREVLVGDYDVDYSVGGVYGTTSGMTPTTQVPGR